MKKTFLAAATLLGLLLPFYCKAQVVAPARGGTGTGSIPSLGQVLVGQGNGTYAPQATATLGFVADLSGLTTTNLAEGSNLYFTQARARQALSETITGIDYSNSTGIFSLATGYSIPLTASIADWNTAFGWGNHATAGYIADGNTGWDNLYGLFDKDVDDTGDLTEGPNLFFTNTRARSAISLTTTGTSGAATYDSGTGVLNIPNYSTGSGSGNVGTSSAETSGNFPYWTSTGATPATLAGTSTLYYLSGNIGIGTTTPSERLEIAGDLAFSDDPTSIYAQGRRIMYVPDQASNQFIGSFFFGTGFAIGGSSLSTGGGGGGRYNMGFGGEALLSVTSGYQNTAMGYAALRNLTTGYNNFGMGIDALYYLQSGANNVSIGLDSAFTAADASTVTSVNQGVYIGNFASPATNGTTNEIAIGYNVMGNGSNSATLGNDSITKTILKGNLGLGTTSPFTKLSVAGSAYVGGNLTATGTVAFTGLGTGLLKSTSGTVSTATAGSDYENPLTFTYPVSRSANAVSLAFGTTTSNTWAGTQTFTSNPIFSGCADNRVITGTGSSAVTCESGLTYSSSGLSITGTVAIGGTVLDPNIILTTASNAVNPTAEMFGANFVRILSITSANSQNLTGGNFGVVASANAFNATGVLRGGRFEFQSSNTATVSNGYAADSLVYNVGAGTITNGVAYNATLQNLNASGVVSNFYGFRVESFPFNLGTVTNTYGFFVGDITTGTQTNTPYSFYASDADARNYLAGRTGIGTTTPNTTLSLFGGGLSLNPGATARPTCDASTRGMVWNTFGAAGVADTFAVCQKDAADAYSWVTK